MLKVSFIKKTNTCLTSISTLLRLLLLITGYLNVNLRKRVNISKVLPL